MLLAVQVPHLGVVTVVVFGQSPVQSSIGACNCSAYLRRGSWPRGSYEITGGPVAQVNHPASQAKRAAVFSADVWDFLVISAWQALPHVDRERLAGWEDCWSASGDHQLTP
jgi:hypothetical protein